MKNLQAMIGMTTKLYTKSDVAKDITKGVVTCFLTGVWLSSAKMVTRLSRVPKIELNVATDPAKMDSTVLKTNEISVPLLKKQALVVAASIIATNLFPGN